jgi:Domain of unknown function (DUF222)
VSHVPFPAPGPDGDDPSLSGDASRDGADPEAAAADVPAPGAPVGMPGPGSAGDDFDAAADLARSLEEVDSGRVPTPSEEDLRAPTVMFTLGEAADVDPVVLAKMAGPDGLGGQGFGQGQAGEAMPPGPLLAALTEQAASEVGRLSDDELLGMVSAARRLANRAEYLELAGIAEFASRRQAQYAASVARNEPRGQRAGEFADAELAMELLISGRAAGDRMEQATALATRLPRTFAGLGAGAIDAAKAYAVYFYTRFLSDADAAQADAVLADAAPRVRQDTLARKAAALEMKLDPAAARARKEHARKDGRRVEARRELSGNMSYGARELAVEEALAVNAAVDADAAALRRAGMHGSVRELRVLCFLDRLRGRNPLDRLTAPDDPGDPAEPGTCGTPGTPDSSGGSGRPDSPGGSGRPDSPGGHDGQSAAATDPGTQSDENPSDAGRPDGGRPDGGHGAHGGNGGPGKGPSADPASFPALINLLIPAGALLGWSATPGEAGRWGLLDPDDTRSLVQAASGHPRSRWCVTVIGPDGTAAAHGCARGPHQWTPAPPGSMSHGTSHGTRPPPEPDAQQQAQLARLLRALNVTLTPIAKGTCDHRDREDRYEPSRKLKHLIRARTATCPAPGCGGVAWHADIDHTIAWPDGPTCQENLSPPCRHHHRVKQAPGWKLEQTEPGVMRWTAPSRRTYATTPTAYDT